MPSRFRWDDCVLDLDAYRLERAGVQVALEPKAFNVLALMVQRPGHLFTRQEIFDRVWPGTAVTDHALTRIVAQIRRALGDEAREARYLETVPTRGYRWIRPVQTIDAPAAIDVVKASPRAWRFSLVSVVALAVVAIVVLVSARRSDVFGREPAPATTGAYSVQWPVQLTTHAGLDLHPALSPQEDAITFVSDRSGSFEIFVRALDGSATETALTHDGGQTCSRHGRPMARSSRITRSAAAASGLFRRAAARQNRSWRKDRGRHGRLMARTSRFNPTSMLTWRHSASRRRTARRSVWLLSTAEP